jgi:serine-type D-Ala-D-Ala carboxypeptidase/endopeptidase (penicillin-binding protein 4)
VNISFILSFFVALYGVISSAEATASITGLKSAIHKLEKQGNRISAEAFDLKDRKIIFEHKSGLPLNPASVIKIATAYAALRALGVDYRYKTLLFSEPGTWCLKGSGDPSFVSEDVLLFARLLKKRGVTALPKELVLDDTVFDDEWIPEERGNEDSERAYNAPVGGLNFNYNAATAEVFRGSGKEFQCSLDWPHPQLTVVCDIKAGGKTDVSLTVNESKVMVRGKIAEDSAWRKPFRVMNPSLSVGNALVTALREIGVTGEPKIKRGACQSGDERDALAVHESRPLSQIIFLMDKYSNNFIADALIKTLASRQKGMKLADTKTGVSLLIDALAQIGIKISGGRSLVSGSGLTRDNAMAASDFSKLWEATYDQGAFFPEWAASMPIAGVDGTMKKRYRAEGVTGQFRAKTGSLSGVMSFSGLFPGSRGRFIAFTWIQNGPSAIPETEVTSWLRSLGRAAP